MIHSTCSFSSRAAMESELSPFIVSSTPRKSRSKKRSASSSPQRSFGDGDASRRQINYFQKKLEAAKTELELKVHSWCNFPDSAFYCGIWWIWIQNNAVAWPFTSICLETGKNSVPRLIHLPGHRTGDGERCPQEKIAETAMSTTKLQVAERRERNGTRGKRVHHHVKFLIW